MSQFDEFKKKASDFLTEAWDKAEPKITELRDKAEPKVKELRDKAEPKLREFRDKAEPKLNDLREKAEPMMKDAKSRATDLYSDVKGKVAELREDGSSPQSAAATDPVEFAPRTDTATDEYAEAVEANESPSPIPDEATPPAVSTEPTDRSESGETPSAQH